MGTRLMSPAASVAGRPAPRTALGRLIAEAAETYGIFIVDTGGNGMTLVTEAGQPVSDMTRYEPDLQEDLANIVRRVRVAPLADAGHPQYER